MHRRDPFNRPTDERALPELAGLKTSTSGWVPVPLGTPSGLSPAGTLSVVAPITLDTGNPQNTVDALVALLNTWVTIINTAITTLNALTVATDQAIEALNKSPVEINKHAEALSHT